MVPAQAQEPSELALEVVLFVLEEAVGEEAVHCPPLEEDLAVAAAAAAAS